jgi:hypothetical protein
MENFAEVSFYAVQSVAKHVTLRRTQKNCTLFVVFNGVRGGGREDGKFSLLGSHCSDRGSFVS